MKILHTVESYLPARHGMQEVVTQLSERLMKLGHDVTIATSYNEKRDVDQINGIKIISFKIKGNAVTGMSGEVDLYQNFLKAADFDIITNFAAQQWATDLMLPILNDLRGKKIFVPTGFSNFYNPLYADYFKNMQTWIKNYDSSVYLANDYRDINFAKEYNAKNIVLIPNGADKQEFEHINIDVRKKYGITAHSFLILTVGSHTGLKGHSESIEIFKKSKLKHASLIIVGNSDAFTIVKAIKTLVKTVFSSFNKSIRPSCKWNCGIKAFIYNHSYQRFFDKNKMVSLHLIRDEVVAMYKAADVFLFPSNIECSPIVLFEACAAKLPFLVTDVGNSIEIAGWTKGGKVMKTIKNPDNTSTADISDAVRLLRDLSNSNEEREILAETGHKSFIANFTWEQIAIRYENLYKSLLN